MDLNRRSFFSGKIRPQNSHIRLPWLLGEATLINGCTHCGECISACAEGIVKFDKDKFPQVDFADGECTFCGDCVKACDEPLFSDIAKTPWNLIAKINQHCLTLKGVICQSCKDDCPEEAIKLQFAIGKAPKPVIDEIACSGCGACVAPCPEKAITISPNNHLQVPPNHPSSPTIEATNVN